MKNEPHTESPRRGRTRRAARYVYTVVMLLCALPLIAQVGSGAGEGTRFYRDGRSWVEETSGTMTPARNLKVSTDCGNIHVQGGGAQTIRYVIKKRSYVSSEADARKQFERYRITATRNSDTAVIEGRWTNGRSERFSTDITVEVPRDMTLVHLDTRGGNLGVNGTTARVELDTQGGNVVVDDVGSVRVNTQGGNVTADMVHGDTQINSGGGNIRIGDSQGKGEINTAGGNVTVKNLAWGSIQTGGGSIQVGQSRGDLTAETGGGSIDVNEVQGTAKLQTGGGNIRLGSARGHVMASTGGGSIEMWKLYQGAQAQTGAGAITAEFLGGKGASSSSVLRTAAGDVIVYVGSGVPCTIHASAEMASGQGIRSEFSDIKITSEGGTYGPRSVSAEGAINGGGTPIKIRTTIGQIDIRKAR
ncbi:MAG: hypothetical protein ROO76_09000 [Terriglobia bacterium]|nr:hypothetical protein [Terriglobia bacterium]